MLIIRAEGLLFPSLMNIFIISVHEWMTKCMIQEDSEFDIYISYYLSYGGACHVGNS